MREYARSIAFFISLAICSSFISFSVSILRGIRSSRSTFFSSILKGILFNTTTCPMLFIMTGNILTHSSRKMELWMKNIIPPPPLKKRGVRGDLKGDFRLKRKGYLEQEILNLELI